MKKFGWKKERTYCGKTWEQMNEILNTLCDLEDDSMITEKEAEAMETAIQSVVTVMNRMKDNRKICFD